MIVHDYISIYIYICVFGVGEKGPRHDMHVDREFHVSILYYTITCLV